MAPGELKWPFGSHDGGPSSRPLVPDLEDVLIVMLDDDGEAARARDTLQAAGFDDDRLRLYPSGQILAYDEEFRANRSVAGRIVGAIVDDDELMSQYVADAQEGRAALWVLTTDRDEASRVVQLLSDHEVVHVWYHGEHGLETIHVR